MRLLGLIFLVGVLGVADSLAQTGFKGLVPLISSKEDVERTLGKPEKLGRYELDDFMVRISFREHPCEVQNDDCACLATIGTVLRIETWPNFETHIEALNLDPAVWVKRRVSGDHVPDIEVYLNKRDGISVQVDADTKLVRSTLYEGSSEVCARLRKKHSR